MLDPVKDVGEALNRAVEGRGDTTMLAFSILILFAILIMAMVYLVFVTGPRAWSAFSSYMKEQRGHLENIVSSSNEMQEKLLERHDLLQAESNQVIRDNTAVMSQVKEFIRNRVDLDARKVV